MDQSSLPSESIISQTLTLEELLLTLARLQGTSNTNPLDVMEREIGFLGSKVREAVQMGRLKMVTMRKKIEGCQEEASQQLPAAQSFETQLQKNLQQSKRECQKRADKLERERLHRDIQIRSLLDDHVLAIAEQNESSNQLDEIIQSVGVRVSQLKEEICKWRTQSKSTLEDTRVEVLDLQTKKREWEYRGAKRREALRGCLARELQGLSARTREKLIQLRKERQRSEGGVIGELQKLIERGVDDGEIN